MSAPLGPKSTTKGARLGRPLVGKRPRVKIQISIDEDTLARIDALCAHHKISRGVCIDNLASTIRAGKIGGGK